MSSEALHRRSYENESNNWVPACRSFSEGRYFDDLKTNYQKSQIVQSNNYYAFGLQTKDSWTRMDTKPNQYLYNAGSELNEATSNYEMMFRSYDPAIGRMNGVDILASKYASYSPYNYSINDPIYYNDPSGAEYEWSSMGGCGCWKDKGPQDAHAGGHSGSGSGRYKPFNFGIADAMNASADAAFDNLNGGFSAAWNSDTYGSASMGGSAFNKMASGGSSWDVNFTTPLGDVVSTREVLGWDKTNQNPLWRILAFDALTKNKAQSGGTPNTHSQSKGNGFEVAGAIVGAFETGTAIGLHQTTKGGTAVQLAKKGAYLGGKTLSRTLGGIGIGLTAANLVYEYNTGNINTHSFVDAGIAIGTFAAGAIAITVGAPVIAVGAAVVGIGYGIFSIAGGESLIDNASGDWGSKLIYGGK